MIAQPSLIEYPCDFPLRIIGHAQQNFSESVLTIVKRHAPNFDSATMETRISKQSTYVSFTCTIQAVSRPQLDELYRELCDHPMVVMVL